MTVLLTMALIRGGSDLTVGWGSLSCLAALILVDIAIVLARPQREFSAIANETVRVTT
jgi:hypothetical protein